MNQIKQQGAVMRPLLLCVVGAFLLLACQTAGDRSETYDSAELKLPATFKGTLPCADCEGIRYHLDLWPDGVFHLRQSYEGTPVVVYNRGRWRRDASRPVILLYGGRERSLQFDVKGPQALRLLDQQGWPIQSSLPYELTSDGTLTPADLSLVLKGMFRYLAGSTLRVSDKPECRRMISRDEAA
jgi:copper homeostasis protein (lipoprotein)